jgi:pyridoxine 5-phosphate synthase
MLELKPHRVTLVPERPEEITTEGGLNLLKFEAEIRAACAELSAAGILVSLFIDPDPEQVAASALPGVDMIELNTARYAEEDPAIELKRLHAATVLGMSLGIEVAAGHGLTHLNLPALVEAVPEIVEYNIGHSLISRAVFVGLESAVRDLVAQIR